LKTHNLGKPAKAKTKRAEDQYALRPIKDAAVNHGKDRWRNDMQNDN